MLPLMEDPIAGVAALFENVSSIVHKGKQPNAQSTPIFIDEYNTTTSSIDCCRNDKTFAPLWMLCFSQISLMRSTIPVPHTARHTPSQVGSPIFKPFLSYHQPAI